MNQDKVTYTRLRTQESLRRTTLEGQLIDDDGRPIAGTRGWAQHPQQGRVRRLQPAPDLNELRLREEAASLATQHGGTTVTVNNNGQNYRPWKEELLISSWKSGGNLLAWPVRLVGRFVESIMLMFAGVLKILLLAVVLPSMLFAGMSFYQSHKDQPATETAAEIGKSGVHIVGAVVGGIWDGIFGDDEPVPAASEGTSKKK